MPELEGLRIVVTRPRDQAAEMLEQIEGLGGEPVLIPAIEIDFPSENQPLDRSLQKLDCYDWVVFTSVNGVKAVWDRMARLELNAFPDGIRIAAIGPKTAQELEQKGVETDFMPAEYRAEAVFPGLGEVEGRRVLLPRAEIARPALAELIQEAGGIAHEVAAYHTLPGKLEEKAAQRLAQGVDWLTFTSSSTVRNFIKLVEKAGLNPLQLPGAPHVACIGPITAGTAEEKGYAVQVSAEEYTVEGLLGSLTAYLGKERADDNQQ